MHEIIILLIDGHCIKIKHKAIMWNVENTISTSRVGYFDSTSYSANIYCVLI